VDAAETAPTTATTTVVTPRTQRTGPLLAVIGGSALAAALLLGGGVLLGFNLGHADHQPRIAQELLPGTNQGPLMNGPRSDIPRGGDLRETGPRQAPQQNQQPVKPDQQPEPDTDSN
jgi:hypothetical protein